MKSSSSRNNSSSDTTGYFSGFTEGSPITLSGQTWYISYNGGTGNDVVLRGTPQVSGTSGSDTFTLSFSTGKFWITNGIYNTELGATLANGIVIKGGAGNDTLNLNLAGLTSVPTINFDGGAAGNDALSVTGATTTTVTHSFTNASDGAITRSPERSPAPLIISALNQSSTISPPLIVSSRSVMWHRRSTSPTTAVPLEPISSSTPPPANPSSSRTPPVQSPFEVEATLTRSKSSP
ncbi:MAG UNVERIFIED_CONTAM: hypothetical protein LVR18_34600 [Planctomycetaceae bacterium]|jgi:hypothetical protein